MADVDPMLQVRLMPQAVVVTLECAELMSTDDIAALEAELMALLEDDQRRHLVIDLRKVRHVSSSALGCLVKFRNLVSQQGGRLRLCCGGHEVKDAKDDTYVYEVFKITKLDKFFELADDVEAALATLP